MKEILKKLLAIQCELKCKKDKQASSYKYRSAEDILENLKPILEQTETTLIMKDEVVEINSSSYFKTTVTLYDLVSEESIENYSYTKEWSNIGTKKDWTQYEKMSEGQLSGATISYCRKYALCWMFAIDDGDDLDKIESKKSSVEERLEESWEEWYKTSKQTFFDRVNKADKTKMEIDLLLNQWRTLIKSRRCNEEDKKQITEICVGMKSLLEDNQK